jgi:two-component system, cell cycle sensor histidine kinase and response regulator CckA
LTASPVRINEKSGQKSAAPLNPVQEELEKRVRERTEEVAKSNRVLLAEIDYRRRVEKKLLETQERYRSIFENAVEGIFQSTPDGTYLHVNPAMARIKGYDSPEELIAAVGDIGQQTYVDPNRRLEFKSLMEKHGVVLGFEYQAYRKDGSKVWLSMNTRAARNAEGAILYYEGTVEDISQRKRLETQLRLAQKMEAVGQLAGGIAHDFNNLLAVIMGYSEMLEEQSDPGTSLHKGVTEIRKAGQRAVSLTRQLLAFGRQEAFDPKVLNLNTAVKDTELMLRRLVGEDIELTTSLAQDLGYVKADLGQLEQVIVNLVVNARDAMPDGGKVIIETANVDVDAAYAARRGGILPGSFVLLAVSDTGTGMDVETQSHIFEPFFTTKERGKGTGLGLSTAYGAIKQNEGFIWVDSEPEKGTRFQILLRRVQVAEPAVPYTAHPHRSLMGKETILLVEDDASLREFTRKLLTEYGYSVLEASDGAQAGKIVRQSHGEIHLLLTDVVMPKVSGPQLADELLLLVPAIKVVYMSGYTQFAPRFREAIERRPLLRKPFTRNDLVTKVRDALDGCAAKPAGAKMNGIFTLGSGN